MRAPDRSFPLFLRSTTCFLLLLLSSRISFHFFYSNILLSSSLFFYFFTCAFEYMHKFITVHVKIKKHSLQSLERASCQDGVRSRGYIIYIRDILCIYIHTKSFDIDFADGEKATASVRNIVARQRTCRWVSLDFCAAVTYKASRFSRRLDLH